MSIVFQENISSDNNILDEEINDLTNDSTLKNQNPNTIDTDEQTNIKQTEADSLEENIDNKVFEQNEVLKTEDEIENKRIAELPSAEEVAAQTETDKASGKQKLKDLGLNDAEIKALTGA